MENTLAAPVPTRPEEVEKILNTLDRHNSESIPILQQYVAKQAQDGSVDILANLALLRLYQFNVESAKEDVINIVLSKALIRFYSADFTSCLHLLPPYVLCVEDSKPDGLAASVQKLFELYKLLDSARYSDFWEKFEKDDSYADIVSDVVGFEDHLRLSIAKTVQVSCKQIAVSVFQEWSNFSEARFTEWVEKVLGWTIVNGSVQIPSNKDNETKMIVTPEVVRFEQLSKLIKRAYELKV